MKRLTIALFAMLATVIFSLPALAQDAPGFEPLSGIPVMEGLVEDLTQRVVFDKVEGRIIRTRLVGDIELDNAISFYREVLFQLGWIEESRGSDLIFTRDEEHLALAFSNTKPLEVTISLRPLS